MASMFRMIMLAGPHDGLVKRTANPPEEITFPVDKTSYEETLVLDPKTNKKRWVKKATSAEKKTAMIDFYVRSKGDFDADKTLIRYQYAGRK